MPLCFYGGSVSFSPKQQKRNEVPGTDLIDPGFFSTSLGFPSCQEIGPNAFSKRSRDARYVYCVCLFYLYCVDDCIYFIMGYIFIVCLCLGMKRYFDWNEVPGSDLADYGFADGLSEFRCRGRGAIGSHRPP